MPGLEAALRRGNVDRGSLAELGDFMAYFPVEVAEQVLDYLRDDRSTLHAAGLVRSSWRTRSVGRLLTPTIICHFSSFNNARTMLDNVVNFLSICRSPQCTILTAMETVILFIQDPGLYTEVIDILSHATQLKKVVLIHCGVTESTRPLSEMLPQLRQLVIEPLGRIDFAEMTDPTTKLYQLESLSLYLRGGVFYNIPLELLVTRREFVHLHTLRLQLPDPAQSEKWFQWAQQLSPPPHLHTFEFCISTYQHRGIGPVDFFNSFLRRIRGTQLRHCSISTMYAQPSNQQSDAAHRGAQPPEVTTALNLAPLVGLETLTFRIHDMRWATGSINTLPCPTTLKSITADLQPWGTVTEICSGFPLLRCQCDLLQELVTFAGVTAPSGRARGCPLNLLVPSSLTTRAEAMLNGPHFAHHRPGSVKISTNDPFGIQADTISFVLPSIFKKVGYNF